MEPQQPNPFDPSPKRARSNTTLFLPVVVLGGAVVVTAIGNARDDAGLKTFGGVAAVVGLALLAVALLPRVVSHSATARWSIKISPTTFAERTLLGSGLEEQIREKLDAEGVHLTDEQVQEALRTGSVTSRSDVRFAIAKSVPGPSGPLMMMNGKTIDPAAILANGTEALATVEGFEHATGPASSTTTGDLFMLTLAVAQPGGEPRRVMTLSVVPPERRHLLSPGTSVPVKVSRDDPDLVAVDWSHVIERVEPFRRGSDPRRP